MMTMPGLYRPGTGMETFRRKTMGAMAPTLLTRTTHRPPALSTCSTWGKPGPAVSLWSSKVIQTKV